MKNAAELKALSRIERQRLHPRITDPNFLVLRSRRIIFQKWIKSFGGELRILDIGGRYQPYRSLFVEQVGCYIAVDTLPTELVDVVASGEALPFASNSFDVVLATQVFDYFSEPRRATEEIYRVLKTGGRLLMSVPSFAPRFADGELWRFTAGGIRATLARFSVVEILPEMTSLGGLCRTANLALHTFVHFSLLRKLYEITVCPALNLTGLALERARLTRNDQFTPNYSVLAAK